MMKLIKKVKINPLTYVIILIALLSGLIKYLIIVSSILCIHEMGHLVIAHFFKRKIVSIEMLPFGGLIKIDSLISENIYEDLLIAIGGIFFQTLFGFILILLHNYNYIATNYFKLINDFNITIIMFNLIPINPLDGSKILKLIQELIIPFKKTFIISFFISILLLFATVLTNITIIKENILIFAFLVVMVYTEYKNKNHLMNRFYIERMNREFKFNKDKKIKKKDDMFKNKNNFIDGKSEIIFLKEAFYGKNK